MSKVRCNCHSNLSHQFQALSLSLNIDILIFELEVYYLSVKHLIIPSSQAFTCPLTWPLANSRSLIFWRSLVMSFIGCPQPKSLDPSGFIAPNGGFTISTSTIFHPLKVSLIASKEHKMRINSSDGSDGSDGGGPWNNPPWPRFPCLTILN